MGKYSHLIFNFGNIMGKYSHDIHNVVIKKKVATFHPKNPIITSWESTASQKYPKCGIPCLSFFPIIGNFPIYFPTGNFEKFPVSAMSPPQKNHENKFSLVSVMAAMLRDYVVVVVVVVVRTRPRVIPLAMITTKKSLHGIPLISHDAYGASFPAALRALGAPLVLNMFTCYTMYTSNVNIQLSFTMSLFYLQNLQKVFCTIHCA